MWRSTRYTGMMLYHISYLLPLLTRLEGGKKGGKYILVEQLLFFLLSFAEEKE